MYPLVSCCVFWRVHNKEPFCEIVSVLSALFHLHQCRPAGCVCRAAGGDAAVSKTDHGLTSVAERLLRPLVRPRMALSLLSGDWCHVQCTCLPSLSRASGIVFIDRTTTRWFKITDSVSVLALSVVGWTYHALSLPLNTTSLSIPLRQWNLRVR